MGVRQPRAAGFPAGLTVGLPSGLPAGRPAGRPAGLPAGLVLVLGLALSGCSSSAAGLTAGGPVQGAAVSEARAVGAAATTTPAVELRAGLTWLLVERVHLAGEARAAIGAAGDDRAAPRARPAVEELDRATRQLAELVGGLPEPLLVGGLPEPLLAALRAQDDLLLSPDAGGPALSARHDRLAQLLADRVPGLSAAALQRSLDDSTAPLLATRSLGTRSDPATADACATASMAAAGLLAEALAAQRSLGSTRLAAGDLRAGLTGLLVARSWTAGRHPAAAITGELAAVLVPEAGPAQARLLAALRAQDAALAAGVTARRAASRTGAVLARGVAAGAAEESVDSAASAAGAALARGNLQLADRQVAAALQGAVPALSAELVLDQLDPNRGTRLAAAVAAGTGRADAVGLLAQSAARAPALAAVLAAALADQRRLP